MILTLEGVRIMVFSNAQPFPYLISPISNVTPFTYSDGITYLEKLEQMRVWLNDSLVPQFNAGIDNAIAEFQLGISNAEETITDTTASWQVLWQDFKDNVELELAALNDSAITGLVNNNLSAVYGALVTLIDGRTVSDAELSAALSAALADYTNDTDLTVLLDAKLDDSQRGANDGVASLDGTGKVPPGQLPTVAPGTLYGDYASRPVATSVTNGTVYFASDTKESYRSNGASWSVVGNGGNELGYAEISGQPMTQAIQPAEPTVTGLTISFVAGERPVQVNIEGKLANYVAGATNFTTITMNGATKAIFDTLSPVSDKWQHLHGEVRINNLTPGVAYTLAVKVKSEIVANGRLLFGSDAYLQVVNV